MITSVRTTRSRVILLAWATLMALTALSWHLAGDSHGGLGVEASSILIIVLTCIKVLIVGYVFMEIHWAIRRLRAVFTCWCAAVCAMLVTLYLIV